MKQILIDIYKTKEFYTGLGQFESNFAHEAEESYHDNFEITYLIPANGQMKNNYPHQIKDSLSKRWFPQLNKTYDLWHSLQQFPSHLPNKKTKFILTVHDLNFLVDKTEEKADGYLKKLQSNIDRAEVVTAISMFTKNQLEDHIDLKGKPVRVIYNGVKLNKYTGVTSLLDTNRTKFFFSIGVFKETKNFDVLLPLIKYFPEHQLIIAGNCNTKYGQQIKQLIQAMNLTDKIILTGEVSDEQKFWLYSHCEAFLFPSVAEGFGLPVIEAMSCGKPVFLSKFSSLPEIGANFAFYFSNFNPENMAGCIKRNLETYSSNENFHSGMMKHYAAKFNWNNCFNEYLKIYDEILGTHSYTHLNFVNHNFIHHTA
jgi:glycosyltransferase involved in cell wall biosynthesis